MSDAALPPAAASSPGEGARSSHGVKAAKRPKVRRAIGPRLRPVLRVVWVLLAFLAANSAYLAGISLWEWIGEVPRQTYFFQWMFLGHVVIGLLLVVPFLVFAIGHMRNTHNRRNRRAVRVGYVLFAVSLLILFSGLALLRLPGVELTDPRFRSATYWAHVLAPVAAVWLYSIHRLVGPKLKWGRGVWAAGTIAAGTVAMAALHHAEPPQDRTKPAEGAEYFEPSLARTRTGAFIPAERLMDDAYCLECHPYTHGDWAVSAHRFSSFNNPAYLTSIRETRAVGMERDGDVKASRWCAGCHDPVVLFSGAFDDPSFDDRNHPTAHAGITCTVCHAIDEVPTTRGNADYIIDEPTHYPMADAESDVLKWISNQLVKANPSFHKQTFLKPVHGTADFCASCHKVHLPGAVTDYRPFLRGQNHYDSWLLSGVSGHGARSFYYPETAQSDCNGCHMPKTPSGDFGADFDAKLGQLAVKSHLFPAANTAIPWMLGEDDVVERQRAMLEGVARVDLFGVRLGDDIDAELVAPLRPSRENDDAATTPGVRPQLVRGQTHLLESVIRTLKVGHHFTQGTIDSNEIWLDVVAVDGDGNELGASGRLDETTAAVDPASHFVNAFVVDREGRRINRRNAQDIFVKVYDHQIPPGAGQVVHYRLDVPADAVGPITVRVALQYRKFDQEYLQIIANDVHDEERLRGDDRETTDQPLRNELPITTIATDEVTFELVDELAQLDRTPIEPDSPTDGSDASANSGTVPVQSIVGWQRWNDYGIGLLLSGRTQLRQAEEAFEQVEEAGRFDGPMNLARVYLAEGRLDEATAALGRARTFDDPAPPPWTLAWLSGRTSRQQGNLDDAAEQFELVVGYESEDTRRRGFDFSLDAVVWNDLGLTRFDLAKRLRGESRAEQRAAMQRAAIDAFEKVLTIDSEDATSHFNLAQLHRLLGNEEQAEFHAGRHRIYKPDDNAADRAVRLARQRYPAANAASEAVVIYDLLAPIEARAETAGRLVLSSDG